MCVVKSLYLSSSLCIQSLSFSFDPILFYSILFFQFQLNLIHKRVHRFIAWDMDSSVGQHQEMSRNSMENMVVSSKQNQERKPRPQQEQALKCPRCDSINTKFCYYNNYSLSQPRYFCKSCRRYWTKGGTLRNVPVGGGCRKNKRSSSSSSSCSKKTQLDHLNPDSSPLLSSLPPLTYDSNDLTLAFARLHKHSSNAQLGFDHDHDHELDLSILGNPTNTHFDILGNPNIINQNSFGFQNGFYGYNGNGSMGEMENCGDQMMVPYDQDHNASTTATTQAVTVTTMKQELCSFGREDESKILWGFPWQFNNGNNGIGDIDSSSSGRESSWNNIHGIASSWHGVLNSPLM